MSYSYLRELAVFPFDRNPLMHGLRRGAYLPENGFDSSGFVGGLKPARPTGSGTLPAIDVFWSRSVAPVGDLPTGLVVSSARTSWESGLFGEARLRNRRCSS